MDQKLGDINFSTINMSELSLPEADYTSGSSFICPYLDEIQPDSFTLASLNFTACSLVEDTNTIISFDMVHVLGDGFGQSPTRSVTADFLVNYPAVSLLEPGALVLMGLGLVGLGLLQKKGYTLFNRFHPNRSKTIAVRLRAVIFKCSKFFSMKELRKLIFQFRSRSIPGMSVSER